MGRKMSMMKGEQPRRRKGKGAETKEEKGQRRERRKERLMLER